MYVTVEINGIGNRKREKINETKNRFFEKRSIKLIKLSEETTERRCK